MKNEVDEIFILINALCSTQAVSNLVLSIHHEIKYIHQVTYIYRFLNPSQSVRDKNFYKFLWRVHGTKYNSCYSYKCNCLITFLKHKKQRLINGNLYNIKKKTQIIKVWILFNKKAKLKHSKNYFTKENVSSIN